MTTEVRISPSGARQVINTSGGGSSGAMARQTSATETMGAGAGQYAPITGVGNYAAEGDAVNFLASTDAPSFQNVSGESFFALAILAVTFAGLGVLPNNIQLAIDQNNDVNGTGDSRFQQTAPGAQTKPTDIVVQRLMLLQNGDVASGSFFINGGTAGGSVDVLSCTFSIVKLQTP